MKEKKKGKERTNSALPNTYQLHLSGSSACCFWFLPSASSESPTSSPAQPFQSIPRRSRSRRRKEEGEAEEEKKKKKRESVGKKQVFGFLNNNRRQITIRIPKSLFCFPARLLLGSRGEKA